jgi:gamma-glutamyltranspeptidase
MSFIVAKIAQAILKTSAALGGIMEAGDLAEFASGWVDPISIDYRGGKVTSFLPVGRVWLRWKC